jgi:hypothetical protein
MLNNVVGHWAYIGGTYIRGGGLILGWAYIWEGASSRRFTVLVILCIISS